MVRPATVTPEPRPHALSAAAPAAGGGSVGSAAARPADLGQARLLRRAREGDREAFEELLELHQRKVYGTAWRLLGRQEDAQDAAQEVFLKLYRALPRLDPGRSVAGWLYRVTVNVCRDLGRRRGRAPEDSLDALGSEHGFDPRDPAPGPQRRAEGAEERRRVLEALATLPEKERAALVLRDVQGLSTAEVAEALGSSRTTVRSQISRARLKLARLCRSAHQHPTEETP